MRFLALFFVSALVISASAELNTKAINDLFVGFTRGMNYPELNPSFVNCSITSNKTKQYAYDVVVASEQENPEAFATAVSNFGFSFAASIRSCGKAARLTRTLFEIIGNDARNVSKDTLMTRIITNIPAFTLKYNALKYAFQNANFVAAGQNFAEILKLFLYNALEMSTPQLEEVDDLVLIDAPKLAVDFFGLVLGIQGFIEEANTTVVVDHYTSFVNDTTYLFGRFPALQDAITAENFSAIVNIVTDIYKYIGVVATEFQQVKAETTAFVQRDLPLFDNEAKVAKAVESLFFDLPTTLSNIMRISTAYKNADYRELGHGSGGIYNQLRKGAQN